MLTQLTGKTIPNLEPILSETIGLEDLFKELLCPRGDWLGAHLNLAERRKI